MREIELIEELLKAIEFEENNPGQLYYRVDTGHFVDTEQSFHDIDVGSIFRYKSAVYRKITPVVIENDCEGNPVWVNSVLVVGNGPLYRSFDSHNGYSPITHEVY